MAAAPAPEAPVSSPDQMSNPAMPWRRHVSAPTLPANEEITFFGNMICPFAHRSFWALLEKGGEGSVTNWVHIDLGPTKPAWYKEEISSFATVPCVASEGQKVYDSSVVNEWLEERFAGQGTPLLPSSLYQRATSRLLCKEFGDKLAAIYKLVIADPNAEDTPAKHEAMKKLWTFVEAFYAEHQGEGEGPYLFGDALSLADITWVPFMYRFRHVLPAFHGIDIWDGGAYPRLQRCLEACVQRPAFQPTQIAPARIVGVYNGLNYRSEATRGQPYVQGSWEEPPEAQE